MVDTGQKGRRSLWKSLYDGLHTMQNPIFRVKRRFSRYLIITCCTGLLSFLTALFLLHSGFKPFITLVLSVCVSGIINYAALELWAFPHRRGRLSWRRLLGNALVGLGGFIARWSVLTLGLTHFGLPEPYDKAIPLALAYIASFIIGYLLRSHIVFKRNPASTRTSANHLEKR